MSSTRTHSLVKMLGMKALFLIKENEGPYTHLKTKAGWLMVNTFIA